MDTYGTRLKIALDRKEKDRAWLADRLGISVQAVGQVMTGKTRAFAVENHERAVRELGCSGFWLATGEGDINDANKNHHDQITAEAIKLMQAMTQGQKEGALSTLRMYTHNLAPPHDGQALQMAG